MCRSRWWWLWKSFWKWESCDFQKNTFDAKLEVLRRKKCCAEEKSRRQTTWALGRPGRLTESDAKWLYPSTRGVGGWERKKREKGDKERGKRERLQGKTRQEGRVMCVEYMLNYISYIVDVASYLTPLSYPIMRQPFERHCAYKQAHTPHIRRSDTFIFTLCSGLPPSL